MSKAFCSVSGGALSACTTSGVTPLFGSIGIVLNSAGTVAFITDINTNNITQCSVSGSTLSSCSIAATGFSSPFGIVLNSVGTTAFITNFGGTTVFQCAVSGGTLSSCASAS